MHGPPQVTLPRPNREKSPESPRYYCEKPKAKTCDSAKYLEKPISKYLERQKSLERTCYYDPDRKYMKEEKEKPMKYFEDDGFEENLRYFLILTFFNYLLKMFLGIKAVLVTILIHQFQKCVKNTTNLVNVVPLLKTLKSLLVIVLKTPKKNFYQWKKNV